jgi:pimeloyl-ACP methyl ester carboxylesterase
MEIIKDISTTKTGSNVTARTQFLETNAERYAYRRFGNGSHLPLLFLQHFTGTLDNWDPAVTDPLASGREVILFDNAGVGRSSGSVPETVAGMAQHTLAFLDGLGLTSCDVLGFSLGGMVAQQMVENRPSIFRKMILVLVREAEKTSCISKSQAWRSISQIRSFEVMRCCPRSSLRPQSRVRKPGRHLLEGWHNGRKTWSPPPDRRLPQPKWQRFVSGSNFLESALRT